MAFCQFTEYLPDMKWKIHDYSIINYEVMRQKQFLSAIFSYEAKPSRLQRGDTAEKIKHSIADYPDKRIASIRKKSREN